MKNLYTETDITDLSPYNIHKTEGGLIYINLVTVSWSPWNMANTKKDLLDQKTFYKEHAIVYPHHTFKTCGGPEAFTCTTIIEKYVVVLRLSPVPQS